MHNKKYVILRLAIVFVFLSIYYAYVINFIKHTNSLTDNRKSTVNWPSGQLVNPFKNNSMEIPIFTYHYVEIVTDKNDFIRKQLSITPRTFERQLIEIKNKCYTPIFVKDIPFLLRGTNNITKPVALTFDDGYRDFYTDVYPLLKKYNAKATIYLVSSFIGANNNYMDKQQINEILKSGLVDIGDHTLHHVDLTKLTQEQLTGEINLSKEILENMYGIKVYTFAYPYGFYNKSIVKILEETGFSTGVSEVKGTIQNKDNLYFLSRISAGSFYLK
jgi:peptidoglycan/xylan/chitin deacetylase (PgdA/CDA1 family)